MAITHSAGAQCVNPPAKMTAWWTLDEPTAIPADDDASFNNVGTPIGVPTSVPGVVNTALSFNGTSDFVTVADHADLNFGPGSMSIDAWVRTSSGSAILPIVDKRSWLPVGYALFLVNGNLAFQMADNPGVPCPCGPPPAPCQNYISSGPGIADGNWHHVAVTINREVGIAPAGVLYVDGTAIHTFTPRPGDLDNTGALWIGRMQATVCSQDDFHWNGEIDEVELFCRALPDWEVSAIFNAGSEGKCHCLPPPDDMRNWWPFDYFYNAARRFDDIAGTVNNHSFYQSAPVPVVPGMVDCALSLSGGQYVSAADQAELNFGTGSMSIDAWIQTTATGVRPIIDKRSGGLLPQGYTLYLVNGLLGFQMADGVGSDCICGTPGGSCQNYIAPSPVINDGWWHHVAVTVDRTTQPGIGNLYVDGVNVLPGFVPRAGDLSNTADCWIGRHHTNDCDGTDRYWIGEIDELEMFDRALLSAEVTSLYAIDSLGKCKPCCCCPSQDDFDEDRFITAIDLAMLIDILFGGAADIKDPNCPIPRGDDDCDGFTTSLDLAIKIDYLFAGGPPPCDPCALCPY